MENTYIEPCCAFEKDRKNHLSFIVWIVLQKKQYFFENILANITFIRYTNPCCDMIAMKREVAAKRKLSRLFRGANVKNRYNPSVSTKWRQVTVQNIIC